ncbi:Uma2 family endonuclease [Streptomyces antimycoticus]|uniref:Uma2 family endonuclease n=1 Tax=Streptomyces antimycoticus TaxID=68175 RepID=UPI00256FE5D3|nr:Uma2 family endonuclease [Streptomyces antimycoticus]WJD97630.1 Uma2 family endonuclease [Streptomyces antimycoticus]
MTALAHEPCPTVDDGLSPAAGQESVSLDEVLWQAWKAMELPEGYRAEIVEEFIEVSPTGRRRHSVIINRLRDALVVHLADSDHRAYQDLNVIHRRKVFIPDLAIAPRDLDEIPDEEDLGVDASGVAAVFEVVSPGHEARSRDRKRKRRAYARAGIPLYVLIDDFDGDGTVVILTAPDPDKAVYADEHRVPYGTDAVIPDGPAKGFVIGEAVVGP